jgi:ABC-type antimicrobial peptide transport system permease subunit
LVFAGFALLLAAIGIYGVLAYLVAERRREVAIRMALGAERTQVLRLVMTHGVRRTATGLAIGLRTERSDNARAVVIAIAVVAALASWLPAWRASRVDPNVVLRTE